MPRLITGGIRVRGSLVDEGTGMQTFVALLRGVNVGKAKRVRMADFRALLGGLGYRNVSTLLNSGNAVFQAAGGSSASHAASISAAISRTLALDVPVVVKSASELAAIVAGNTIATDASEHSRLFVVFAQDTALLSGLGTVDALVVPPEVLVVGKQAAYLYCARGVLESKAANALLGKAGRFATTRNLSTTLKLHALASAAT